MGKNRNENWEAKGGIPRWGLTRGLRRWENQEGREIELWMEVSKIWKGSIPIIGLWDWGLRNPSIS